LKKYSGIAIIYFKLKNHLKYILIGKESMLKPIIIRKTYLTGPYALNIFFRSVLAKSTGKTNMYRPVTIKPIDSLSITFDGNG
tara:strand:+ start:514 stop:762 length:249 start_codon:yes stop_codon:yes gene_type:complete